jgi:YD repeat-containing protein
LVAYNNLGMVVWTESANGNVAYTDYNIATGAIITHVTDVAFTDTGGTWNSTYGTSYLPSTWTLSTGGLNLATTYTVDDQGRTLSETSPAGYVDEFAYDDPDHQVREFDGMVDGTPTAPTEIYEEDWADADTETLTTSDTPDLTANSLETITPADVASFSRSLLNAAGEVVETDDYSSLASGAWSSMTAFAGTSQFTGTGTVYDATTYDYDLDGNMDRTVDADGTITRTVYDGYDEPVQSWVGTNDTNWNASGGSTPSNMVEVSADAYDADGNNIETVQYPAGNASTGRATEMYYDYRDRVIAEMDGAVDDSGMPSGNASSDPDGNDTFVTYYTLDNLGEVTQTQVYNAEEQPITFDGATYNEPSAVGGWRYILSAGITADSSGVAAGNPSLGTSQVGFVEGEGGMSQTIDFSEGNYTVSLDAAQRAYYNYGYQTIAILVDGATVGTFTPAGTSWSSESASFNVSAGLHTITFDAVDSEGIDQTALIGDVSIAVATGGTGSTPTVADGDFDTPTVDSYAYNIPAVMPNLKLTADSTASYDDMGQVFSSSVVSVDPSTSDIGNTLTTNSYYDADGNLIASIGLTGAATKYTYDGADRNTGVYITDGGQLNNSFNVNIGNAAAYFFAGNVSGDDVLSQTLYVYDGDGNIIETIESDRFGTDSTSAYGPLHNTANTSTGAYARVSYTASFYDHADRDVADVNVGTNDGTDAWSGPTVLADVPSGSLVTKYIYDTDGRLSFETDPLGLITANAYNLLGETTATVANWNTSTFVGPVYTSSLPARSDSANQTTEYTYDGDGNVLTMTAVMPSGETNQTTTYVYGVNTSQGSLIDDNDLLYKVEYPDPNTGSNYNASGQPAYNQAETYTYDAIGEQLNYTDRNGTTHDYSYDLLGRLTADNVPSGDFGANVDQTVSKLEYAYNDQGELEYATSLNSSGGVVNQVEENLRRLRQHRQRRPVAQRQCQRQHTGNRLHL